MNGFGFRWTRPMRCASVWWLASTVAFAAIATGCGGHSTSASPPQTPASTSAAPTSATRAAPSTTAASTSSTSAAATTPTTEGRPPNCATSQLGLLYAGGAGAGGHSLSTYRFTNHSSTTCVMTGYPGVSVLDASGNVVQHPALRDPGPGTTTAVPVTTVTLTPGAVASFLVSSTDTTPNPDCPTAYQGSILQVFPPNQTSAIELNEDLSVCDLTVGPVQTRCRRHDLVRSC